MKTSKIASLMLILASAVLFMGCPYSSEVALSEPTMKVADNFIGTWELTGGEGDKVEIRRTSATTVDIVKISGYDGTTTTYKGHLTDIKGTLFLNVREDYEYSSYYFYKIEKDGDFKIKLIGVTDYIKETFQDGAEMRRFFEANMNNSYFFQSTEEIYYKIK